jgi:ribonuclease Z
VAPEDVEATEATSMKLAIVGDTEETEMLAPLVAGADALVIEATFLDADAGLAARRGHLTAGQAARLARDAGVGALWLTHISGRYAAGEVVAEARRFYPEARVMNDFDRVAIAGLRPKEA